MKTIVDLLKLVLVVANQILAYEWLNLLSKIESCKKRRIKVFGSCIWLQIFAQ